MDAADLDRLKPAEAAAQRLRIDYATAEVLRAFEAARIPSILLKGAGIVRWLYEPGEVRTYMDSDILVPPEHYRTAGEVLAGLGFTAELDDEAMPEWWREHGVSWYRKSDRAAVDLHRTLAGVGADPGAVWGRLSQETDAVEIAGQTARTLATPARALHVALHAAQHGGSTRQADELARALAREDEPVWRAAADLAEQLDAVDAFTRGLRFDPAGTALIAALGLALDGPVAVDVELRAAGTVDGTLTLDRLMRSDSATRLSILRHKVFPPATFMRKWSPLARRGPVGLAAAYVVRPLWLVSKLPQALRDLRAARRAR